MVPGRPQPPGPQGQPLPTEERLRLPGWWPTQSTPRRDEYVGPVACAECHSSQAVVQETTPMANACVRAADSKTLQAHERLSVRLGPYTYEIVRNAGGSLYSVSDGARSISAALGWAFGGGEAGETYIFARAGTLYESQFSYFPILRPWTSHQGTPIPRPQAWKRQWGVYWMLPRPNAALVPQHCFLDGWPIRSGASDFRSHL